MLTGSRIDECEAATLEAAMDKPLIQQLRKAAKMELQTCKPPDLKANARAANERHEKAKVAFEKAQTELIMSERVARNANNAYFKTIYPDWGI